MSLLLLPPALEAIAGALRAAASVEAASLALDQRVERKFALPARAVPDLLAALAPDHRVLLAGGHSWARYESCYLDTPSLQLFDDHRRGHRPRLKLRFRHYLDRRLTVLERKQKDLVGVTVKCRVDRPYGSERLRPKLLRRLGPLPFEAEALGEAARTRYARLTLLHDGDAHRLTIDIGLHLAVAGEAHALPEVAIVELKQAPDAVEQACVTHLLGLGAHEVAFSKYCAAQILCAGRAALGCSEGLERVLDLGRGG